MLSLLLHLYQPPFQDKQTFKRIAEESYVPLFRFLKANKNFKLTLNTPLSFLELLDNYGYETVLHDIHMLLERKQIELVGSGAYHPLLTRLPENIAEKEIILNEYGLGYYFGRKKGFEGENAILINDVDGFFPPELAVNSNLLSLLDELGYRWVLADQTAVLDKEASATYYFEELSIKLMVRNTTLSNMMAFSRTSSVDGLKEALYSTDNHLLAMDGETFGHHNKQGINLLYFLQETMSSLNILSGTYSEYLSNSTPRKLEGIVESTWSTVQSGEIESNTYPLWDSSTNQIQKLQWELFNSVCSHYVSPEMNLQDDQYANRPIWNTKLVLEDIKDTQLINQVLTEVAFLKLLNSDQFFWTSGVTLPLGELLYDKVLIERSLDLYTNYLALNQNIVNTDANLEIISRIKSLI